MHWFVAICFVLLCGVVAAARMDQEDTAATKAEVNTFFSGTVAEFNDKQLVVLRTVLGKPEKHTFLIDSTTKVEGKLRLKVRVTVKFETSEAGDVAKLVRVRPPQQPKKK